MKVIIQSPEKINHNVVIPEKYAGNLLDLVEELSDNLGISLSKENKKFTVPLGLSGKQVSDKVVRELYSILEQSISPDLEEGIQTVINDYENFVQFYKTATEMGLEFPGSLGKDLLMWECIQTVINDYEDFVQFCKIATEMGLEFPGSLGYD